ncbi:hypothetical protein NB037_01520 [Rathayibacter sp. ZW T2_19]|uniref:O-antigen ligase n=1 Tax=Rathayibacter rubneri TaxID=2950106 RepID=A0A9X2DTZ1_9MICO|nr:hypothetical protein [Rathayibacter rubneri]MCM6761085.1 hypothetical protein [Rathayibacter rubneri]
MTDLTLLVLALLFFVDGFVFADLLLGGRLANLQNSSGAVVETRLGTFLLDVVRIPVLLLTFAWIVVRHAQRGRIRIGAVLALPLVTAALLASTWLATGSVGTTNKWWVPPLIAASLVAIGPALRELQVLGWVTGFVALFSLGFGLVSDKAFMLQTVFLEQSSKALIGDRLLAGPFAQMNVLGLSMAAGLPFVFLIERRRIRFVLVAATVAALVLSASRTSIIAVLFVVTAALTTVAFRTVASRRLVLVGFFAVTLGVQVLLPLLTTDPEAFTSRGDIWIRSIERWPLSPVFGFGTGAYAPGSVLAGLLGYASWHGHNVFISAITMGGLILLGAIIVLFVAAWSRAMALVPESIVPAVGLITITSIGWAEVSFRLDDFDGPSWVTWMAVLVPLILRSPEVAAEPARARREGVRPARRTTPVPQTPPERPRAARSRGWRTPEGGASPWG